MTKVKLRDCYQGKSGKTLDELISELQGIRDKYGKGDVPVSILMEPEIDGEQFQLEESLCEVSASVSYVKEKLEGLTSVHLLGRSFD